MDDVVFVRVCCVTQQQRSPKLRYPIDIIKKNLKRTMKVLAAFFTLFHAWNYYLVSKIQAFQLGVIANAPPRRQYNALLLLILNAEKKGFGSVNNKVEPRQKSSKQIQREQGVAKYDEISKKGGQEYNVFVRQFGSDAKSWLPCGSVAVPRGAQVTDAIFSNEAALKEAIVRLFPKLRGSEGEFEYGFNLKIYPDDPIEVAVKGGKKNSGFSVGNWISALLSPVDASEVKARN